MKECRICLDEHGTLLEIGCDCKEDLQFIHLDCADKWFSNRMEITLAGKLKDPTLSVTYRASCEICKSQIAFNICRQIYIRYDKNHKTVKIKN